ncbi:helix-turn-helix domain-containing protein [Bradyrhizobium elkanii]|uniref:helix-turn-helix domain-containing protein n=1 Tax=Bradyrhizobium elkanii TaxID=29448 RepID=UPI000429DACB|nr:helix-turn-helix domain-containing protein [Bradyrhizobium elkanii]
MLLKLAEPATPAPFSYRLELTTDAERLAWALAEVHRRIDGCPSWSATVACRNAGARAFGVEVDDLRARSRGRRIIHIRQILISFTHVVSGASWRRIGRAFDRDHTTIMYTCRKYDNEIRLALGDFVPVA